MQLLEKSSSMRIWVYSRYKRLCNLSSFNVSSEITSTIERMFESFPDLSELEGIEVNNDGDDFDPYDNQQVVPRNSNKKETSRELSVKDSNNRAYNGSCDNNAADTSSGQYQKSRTIVGTETDHSNAGSNYDSGSTRSMDFETSDHGDFSCSKSSLPRDLPSHQILSPASRTPLDFRSNSFDGRSHFSSASASSSLVSPKHHSAVPYTSSTQSIWHFDGDASAMDIFSASRQLCVFSFGLDASESFIRFHLERIGPLEHLFFFPIKGFALVEYRSIIDAIRARDYVRAQFPWRVKFMDIGLGARSSINGVAIGSSCHVYVGNVPNQWVKDEILHESSKVVYRGPYMVNDLCYECALLLEYETPEEATTAMAHLRRHRQSRGYYIPSLNTAPVNVAMPNVDGSRSSSTAGPFHGDIRSNHPGNLPTTFGSPHTPSHGARSYNYYSQFLNKIRKMCSLIGILQFGVRLIHYKIHKI